MANNGDGMATVEIVATSGNCLAGNRKLTYETVMHDAVEDGGLDQGAWGV